MKKLLALMLVIGVNARALEVHRADKPDRDDASNEACKFWQEEVYSRDRTLLNTGPAWSASNFERVYTYANVRGVLACLGDMLNKLGKNDRDRNAEGVTQGFMMVFANSLTSISGIIRDEPEKGRALIGKYFTEAVDLNGVNLLAYGVTSENEYVRQYAYGPLTWATTDKTFCVIADHANVRKLIKTDHGRKGLLNLMNMANLIAPDLSLENYGVTLKLIEEIERSNLAASFQNEKVERLMQSLRVRLGKAEDHKSVPANPECQNYGRKVYGSRFN